MMSMIVCVCAGVSERTLRKVVAEGATSLKQIERRCGAGGGCGACRPLIRECLRAAEVAPAVEFTHADAAAELATA